MMMRIMMTRPIVWLGRGVPKFLSVDVSVCVCGYAQIDNKIITSRKTITIIHKPLSSTRSYDDLGFIPIFGNNFTVSQPNLAYISRRCQAIFCKLFYFFQPSRVGLQDTLTAFLLRGKIPPTNECPGYDTKQPDGEASVMPELWEMRSTPSLP